jgi:hypothetical protein
VEGKILLLPSEISRSVASKIFLSVVSAQQIVQEMTLDRFWGCGIMLNFLVQTLPSISQMLHLQRGRQEFILGSISGGIPHRE